MSRSWGSVGEGAEHLLELRDAVAQRVVVEEEQTGGLGDVHVRVDEDRERLAQVGVLGGVVGGESAERLVDEPAQVGACRG